MYFYFNMKSLDDFGIVVIDMQESFVFDCDKLIRKQNELFDSFRDTGIHVYVMEYENCGETLNDICIGIEKGYNVETYIKNTISCFRDPVSNKSGNDRFYFDEKLKKDRVSKLIFTGVYGDVCVYESLKDAVNFKYDCFFSFDLTNHCYVHDYLDLDANYFVDLGGLVKNVRSL